MRLPLFAASFMLLAAAPGRAELKIANIQASHGPLGPERQSAEYAPGDEAFFRFSVSGARLDAQGRGRGELRLTLTDPAGKVVVDSETPMETVALLGGDTVPGQARVSLGHDTPPGEFKLAVRVTDLIGRTSASFERKFTVKPTAFGLVGVRFYHDDKGAVPARAGGVVGQSLFVRLGAVGFDRSTGVVDVVMEMRAFDAAGKPASPAAVRTAVHSEDAEAVKRARDVSFVGGFTLTRAGDFTLRITVTDTIAQKSTTFEAPLRVEP